MAGVKEAEFSASLCGNLKLTHFEIGKRKKRKGRGTNVPTRLFYFCLIKTYPPTRITTAAPTAPATIAIVKSG